MKYQVVVQFPEELFYDLDWITSVEDRLDESLVDAEVDGHDIGSGEVNIFIHSNNPTNTLALVKNILEEDSVDLENIRVAYREKGGDLYIPLWPENLVDFKVI